MRVPTEVRGGSTVLLLAAGREDAADEACLELLHGGEPERRNVVAVTIERSAQSFLDAWLGLAGVNLRGVRVVDVGNRLRSAAAGGVGTTPTQNVVQPVDDASDLVSVQGRLEALVSAPISPGERRVVYVDSLGALLDAVGLRATLDFLADLRDLVSRRRAIAFVRADRRRHRRYIIDVLSSRLDATLEFDPDVADAWTLYAGWTDRAVAGVPGAPLAVDDVFDVLSARRCRLVLHHLCLAAGPRSIANLAEQLAAVELDGDDGAFDRLYAGLVHVQLPLLASHGLVSVGADGEEIRLLPAARHLEPLLALTAGGERRG